MNHCLRVSNECIACGEKEFLINEQNWQKLKDEWAKISLLLTTDREIERFQSICRYVLLKRIHHTVGLKMMTKLKPELEEIFPNFLYLLCACYFVDLSKYDSDETSKVQVRVAATNAILALKSLQFDLDPPDHTAVTMVPRYTEREGNILLKNIMEGAIKMHLKDPYESASDTININAGDFLDSFTLNNNDPNDLSFKDSAFIKFKKRIATIVEKNDNSLSNIRKNEIDIIKKESVIEGDQKVLDYLKLIS